MSTHTNHSENNQTYFCTITCYKWLPLFEEAKGYEEVYEWFSHLKKEDCEVLGYVIMPNHIHCLLHPTSAVKNLNQLVGEGKRFMAYGIVKRLNAGGKIKLLNELESGVPDKEKVKGKKHQVFRLSFDAKTCDSEKMLEQKLDYIHSNPVSGKWGLVSDFVTYEHSSAGFYELGEPGLTSITHYKSIGDVVEG